MGPCDIQFIMSAVYCLQIWKYIIIIIIIYLIYQHDYLSFMSDMTYDKWYMTKTPYFNMCVNSSVKNSTINPPAPKMLKRPFE